MSNFISTIGSFILLAGFIVAVYWAYGLIRGRRSGHAGRNALILVVLGFILSGVGGSGSSHRTVSHSDSAKASLVSKKSPHKKAVTHVAKKVAAKPASTQAKKKATPKPAPVKKAANPAAQQSAILAKLLSYTNSESAGLTGDYYYTNGAAKLTGFEGMTAGSYHFAADSQGRPTTARAVLTYSEYAASRGSRQGDPLEPVGWPAQNPIVAINYKMTGRTYHGYLYNRSHSIGDSLLGAKSYTSSDNFTTGTRPQNVGADQDGGMRAAEETVEDYWESHAGTSVTVDYETTPVYNGSEEIPRGSIVDIKSSDGDLNTEIVVLNDVEGIRINYNDASSDAKPYVKPRSTQQTQTYHAPATSTTTQSHAATSTGGWTIAHSGYVYVSQSNKYYTEVKNPDNYTYETQSAAIASGATQAARGNEYARP